MNISLPIEPALYTSSSGCAATTLFAGAVFSTLQASEFVERTAKISTATSTEGKYDFIIVGGGSAGSVLANRLSEVPDWKVLLLEAGRDEPQETLVPAWFPYLGTSDLNWWFKADPEPQCCNNKPCPVFQGKCLGGGSAINGMMYVRGNRLDYDEWASVGNDGWSYNDVLPYFLKSERNRDAEIANDTRYHSSAGLQDVQWFQYREANLDIFHKGLNKMGYKTRDVNGPKAGDTGSVMVTQSTSYAGERRSTNYAFLKPAMTRKNLLVETFAQVTKVLIDASKTATGVEYVAADGSKRTVKATLEIVLSAGSINSPKLLMLSGIGPKKHLESFGLETLVDLQGVGENLQDHVTAVGAEFILTKTKTNIDGFARVKDFFRYNKRDEKGFHQGMLASNGMLQLTAFFKSKYQTNDSRPDIQHTFFTPLPPVGDFCLYDRRLLDMAYHERVLVTPIVLHPKSRGQVLLRSSDPLDPPRIYQHYFKNRQDLKVLVEGLKEGIKLADTDIFHRMGITLDNSRKKGCEMYKYGIDKYWECVAKKYTWTIMHASGTCKMGPDSDPTAVVDSRLRVKGVKNLRVIDASIMPFITGGNTNAPTIMIGEKGAQVIKNDHGIQN